MNTDIKSLIPSMHAELKRMQSRVAELQVSLQQGSSMASAFNAQSDPGVVVKFFSASQQSMRSI